MANRFVKLFLLFFTGGESPGGNYAGESPMKSEELEFYGEGGVDVNGKIVILFQIVIDKTGYSGSYS